MPPAPLSFYVLQHDDTKRAPVRSRDWYRTRGISIAASALTLKDAKGKVSIPAALPLCHSAAHAFFPTFLLAGWKLWKYTGSARIMNEPGKAGEHGKAGRFEFLENILLMRSFCVDTFLTPKSSKFYACASEGKQSFKKAHD